MEEINVSLSIKDLILNGEQAKKILQQHKWKDIREAYLKNEKLSFIYWCNKKFCLHENCDKCRDWFANELYEKSKTLVVDLI